MIKPWKPEPGDRGPHRDVTLKPFQTLLGARLCGIVQVDARTTPLDDLEKMERWVAERVTCRLTKGATLMVVYA